MRDVLIGERLKKRRLELHLTQQDVSDYVGVSKVSISGYEKGMRTPTLPVLIKLAEYLDLSVDYIVGRDYEVLNEEEEPYKVKISREDMEILSELKSNRELYNEICQDPRRKIKAIFKQKSKKNG